MQPFNHFLSRYDTRKSRDVAKKRLHQVLAHDRANLSPGRLDSLRHELPQVGSKYMEIDPEYVDIALTDVNRQSRLTAQVSVVGACPK
jgi:cell division topological specificity factor MinE